MKLKIDFRSSLVIRFYLIGYKSTIPPRILRKLIARSDLHRAWISGWNGNFTEGDKAMGVVDRQWFRCKKAWSLSDVLQFPRLFLNPHSRSYCRNGLLKHKHH